MVAISNDAVSPMYYTTEYMDWVMREIAYSGISHVEWQFAWEGNHLYSAYEIEQIVGFYEKYRLKAKGLHASDGGARRKFAGMFKHELDYDNRKHYLSFDELNRKAGVALIKNHMDLAQAINAGHIVLHVQAPKTYITNISQFRATFFQQFDKSLADLAEHSEKTGVTVALECVIGVPPNVQCEIFDRAFASYEKKHIGFCYDSGHNMVVDSKSPYSFLEKYGQRLIGVHLQDVHVPFSDGERDDRNYIKSDNHLVPFDGVLDWEYITDLIAKTEYQLPLTLETVSYEGEFHATFFKRNKLVGEQLHEMVIAKRQ